MCQTILIKNCHFLNVFPSKKLLQRINNTGWFQFTAKKTLNISFFSNFVDSISAVRRILSWIISLDLFKNLPMRLPRSTSWQLIYLLFFHKINFICVTTKASHHYIEMLFNNSSLATLFCVKISASSLGKTEQNLVFSNICVPWQWRHIKTVCLILKLLRFFAFESERVILSFRITYALLEMIFTFHQCIFC